MRPFVLLAAAVFLFGIGTQAQDIPQTSSLLISPFEEASPAASTSLPATMHFSLSSSSSNLLSLAPASLSGDSPGAAAPAEPPQVFGVKPSYEFQGYLGYTYFRFYESPGVTPNTNGFNYSIVYFPHQLKNWIGADGEFVLTLGSQSDFKARFLLGLGGVRARWAPFQKNIEIWAHGLAGGSHFVPQTAYGPQGAFGYEIGGGVDINTHHERYAYRVGADMVGTHYFGTYQFSPKISAGFIYRF
jgi:hypothetical protein